MFFCTFRNTPIEIWYIYLSPETGLVKEIPIKFLGNDEKMECE